MKKLTTATGVGIIYVAFSSGVVQAVNPGVDDQNLNPIPGVEAFQPDEDRYNTEELGETVVVQPGACVYDENGEVIGSTATVVVFTSATDTQLTVSENGEEIAAFATDDAEYVFNWSGSGELSASTIDGDGEVLAFDQTAGCVDVGSGSALAPEGVGIGGGVLDENGGYWTENEDWCGVHDEPAAESGDESAAAEPVEPATDNADQLPVEEASDDQSAADDTSTETAHDEESSTGPDGGTATTTESGDGDEAEPDGSSDASEASATDDAASGDVATSAGDPVDSNDATNTADDSSDAQGVGGADGGEGGDTTPDPQQELENIADAPTDRTATTSPASSETPSTGTATTGDHSTGETAESETTRQATTSSSTQDSQNAPSTSGGAAAALQAEPSVQSPRQTAGSTTPATSTRSTAGAESTPAASPGGSDVVGAQAPKTLTSITLSEAAARSGAGIAAGRTGDRAGNTAADDEETGSHPDVFVGTGATPIGSTSDDTGSAGGGDDGDDGGPLDGIPTHPALGFLAAGVGALSLIGRRRHRHCNDGRCEEDLCEHH